MSFEVNNPNFCKIEFDCPNENLIGLNGLLLWKILFIIIKKKMTQKKHRTAYLDYDNNFNQLNKIIWPTTPKNKIITLSPSTVMKILLVFHDS